MNRLKVFVMTNIETSRSQTESSVLIFYRKIGRMLLAAESKNMDLKELTRD